MEEVRAPLAPDAERSVRTAVIGNFVDIFGLCTILPLIPFFVKDVGAPKIWVGLISGAQFLGCCLGNFTWGQVGDRRDPNAVALGLMVGDAVFFALTAACTDAPSLCAVRVLTGFCAFWVLGETLISKVVPGPRVAEYKAKYLGGALLGQIFGPPTAASHAGLGLPLLRRRGGRGGGGGAPRLRDRAAKLATVFGHAHYRAAVFVYCAVGLTFNGVNTVGLFGLGLCFALMLSLSFYETWERTFGVYGMLAVFGPAGVALYGLLAAFGKASLGAFSCLFFASVVVFGPLFNTATMVITNVARTWAPGAEGTALSYASLLHNAAQAAGCAAGPVLFVWCQTALGWRAPWLAAAAATLAFAPRPWPCASPCRSRRTRSCPRAPSRSGSSAPRRRSAATPARGRPVDGAGDAGDAAPSPPPSRATRRPRRRGAGRRGALAVAEPADGATTV
ncbi:major facilitator superfamily-like protein [Aureococcus anophagefferens]|nr:major facilitator superfamily-like protein [Aureococcus anophagefferens]